MGAPVDSCEIDGRFVYGPGIRDGAGSSLANGFASKGGCGRFVGDCRPCGAENRRGESDARNAAGSGERAAKESSPEIRGLLESYARGVNQFIAQQRNRLPIEFSLLGYTPKPWTPTDTYLIDLYMWKTLTSRWKSKLNRQWVTSKVGAERAAQLFVEDSPLAQFTAGQTEAGASAKVARSLRRVTSVSPLDRQAGEAAPFARRV